MEEKQEEFTGSNDDHHHAHIIIKGKRTKRQRPSSPISVAVVTTSSSSSGGAGGGDNCSIPSPIASGYETHESTTEEEEDMANCLILLAQSCSGAGRRNQGCGKGSEKPNTREITDKAVAGSYGVYECNTCNRSFPSFQALGGHRASHKRPKMAMAEEKKPLVSPPLEYHDQFDKIITISPNSTTLFLLHGTNHNKSASSKVHECSICGSEFSSGQALGGHMRRHRSLTTSTNDHQTHEEAEKRRNILPILDLNLPAPDDDDDRETKFQFTASNQLSSLVFSNSPALVDCHY